ncbi:MAG: 5-oxoprolinase subunit PxpB [Rhodanobacter sp.]|jgi:KipI family sensor histidine kinase inhibitor
MSTPPVQFETIAEDALLLRFGEHIDIAVNARVLAACTRLQHALPRLECVPAYASLLLRFDPLAWGSSVASDPQKRLREAVLAALAGAAEAVAPTREHVIPVCYGGACGPDLGEVASHCGLSTDEVIARHVGAEYQVAMIGFAPGFPYLLGLDPTLAMPRRRDPRQRVAAGSVAIGGSQTGIYPEPLPGGWQLIGRTPLRLFDVSAERPSLLAAGDHVRFHAMGDDEFSRWEAEQPR